MSAIVYVEQPRPCATCPIAHPEACKAYCAEHGFPDVVDGIEFDVLITREPFRCHKRPLIACVGAREFYEAII